MNSKVAKKLRQLVRKRQHAVDKNIETMFNTMKTWPFRVRLSLGIKLIIGRRRAAGKKPISV